MPIPRVVASLNRRATNHVMRPIVRHLPGFAVVSHVGRRSGRIYRTPVNLFRHDGDYVFALTYGPESDWAKNVEAAGQCDIETRGEHVHLVDPTRVTDTDHELVPRPVRPILDLLDVDQFVVMRQG